MLTETLALLSGIPALGLLWVSTGTNPPLTRPYWERRMADPFGREEDDDLEEEEEEEEEWADEGQEELEEEEEEEEKEDDEE